MPRTFFFLLDQKNRQFQPPLLPASVAPYNQTNDAEIWREPSTPRKNKLF